MPNPNDCPHFAKRHNRTHESFNLILATRDLRLIFNFKKFKSRWRGPLGLKMQQLRGLPRAHESARLHEIHFAHHALHTLCESNECFASFGGERTLRIERPCCRVSIKGLCMSYKDQSHV